jgi:bifunctional non-homologous end joining protein LigD
VNSKTNGKIVATSSLYFSDGASDKVYHAQVIGDDASGYMVQFQYGRRGSTLQAGTKTATPVTLPKAQQIFDKLVKEKTAKGYSTGIDGTPFAGTENAGRVSGVSLQLLNPISREEAHVLIQDDAWGLQQKMDGERRCVIVDGDVVGVNRKGLTVALPQPIADAARRCLPKGTVIDGEQIGDTLWAFDMLRYDGKDVSHLSYRMRHAALLDAIPGAMSKKDPLRVVGLYETTQTKAAVFDRLEETGAEGVVFKRLNSVHTPNRPATGGDQLKLKFVESATVKVIGMNDGARSARMGLFDAVGNLVDVGSVTIPANAPVPSNGELIEVRYLYAYMGGSLFQPVYVAARTDLDDPAATLAQLKYKAEAATAEAA